MNTIFSFRLTIALLFILSTSLCAQPVVGFWEIKEVKVGTEVMTPVAKWTRIEAGGTYQSGNGWLQNSEGTWTYNEKQKAFLPKETNGLSDPFGAFQVSTNDGEMVWEREEEGMTVSIVFQSIEELPKAPADWLSGLWQLHEVTRNQEVVTAAFDPDNRHYIFFQWDRIYVAQTPAGERATGYWHINSHRPEITLLPHREGAAPESWKIAAADTELRMTGISDTNKGTGRVYRRIHQFPE